MRTWPANELQAEMKRIDSIDATRGLVMVIMALDHVRDFIHADSMKQNPTDLTTTTALLFFTRWITHLCAPTFVFLAGVSAYISFKRKNNPAGSSKFLFSRGILLILVDLTVVNFALWFDVHFRLILMEVISAIGFGFIILSLMVRLPSRITGATGLLIIVFHNLLQGMPMPENHTAAFLYSVFFRPNLLPVSDGVSFYSAYPLIPWLGILLAGFGCGELFEPEAGKKRKLLPVAGAGLLILFTVFRLLNFYGDPASWTVQKSSLFTFLSFINVTKYPPSFLFTILFLGMAFILLFLTGIRNSKVTGFLSVYGRVPFAYFVVHLFLIHALMFLVLFIQGFGSSDFAFGLFRNGRPESGGGVGLAAVYLIWISVVLTLYPFCRWYGNYKVAHRDKKWLGYF